MKDSPMMLYAPLTDYMEAKARQLKFPFSCALELTPLCNMNCKMCYIRMTQEEMDRVGTALPAEEFIRIAREAADMGMTMLLFTGGEALLHPDFKKIYLAVRKMGFFISINTNGTTLTDSWIEFFKQYPPAKFNITIYGGCNETYARLCQNPKGFDQMKASLEKLQACGFEILLNCTLTRRNIHDIDAIYAFGRAHNLPIQSTTYNFPPVRKEGVLDPDQERFLKRAYHILSDLADDDSSELDCASVEGDKVLCAAGRSSFWLTWDGRMLPCGMDPTFSVPARGKAFKDIWKELTAHTAQIRLAPECTLCPKKKLCLPCAAKLIAESGSYGKKAVYKCEYVDHYIRLLGESVRVLTQAPENP